MLLIPRFISALSIISSTKIIASSAVVSISDQQNAFDVSSNACLSKPFRIADLLEMLAEQLVLEWQYQTDKSDPSLATASGTSLPPELVPSQEILQQLWRLSRQGRIPKVTQVLNGLIQDNQEYLSFAQPLLVLSKHYKQEVLESAISAYL